MCHTNNVVQFDLSLTPESTLLLGVLSLEKSCFLHNMEKLCNLFGVFMGKT